MQRDYLVDVPAFSLASAGTAYYLMGLTTSSKVPVDIIDITVGCDATATGTLKVELVTMTDGTGSTATISAVNGGGNLCAATTTGKITYTVNPTGATVIRTWVFPLPTGAMEVELPLGRECTMPVSTCFGLRFTATTVTPHAYATLTFEE